MVSPHPQTSPESVIAMIVNGTAKLALVASSLMCTGASKQPFSNSKHQIELCVLEKYVHMVHSGAKKLKMNAKPFGQPDTMRGET